MTVPANHSLSPVLCPPLFLSPRSWTRLAGVNRTEPPVIPAPSSAAGAGSPKRRRAYAPLQSDREIAVDSLTQSAARTAGSSLSVGVQALACELATTLRNHSLARHRNHSSTHSRSLFRSSYCSGDGTSQTSGSGDGIRNRCRSTNCSRSSERQHSHSSTHSRSLFRSSCCTYGSSDAASQTNGNDGRIRSCSRNRSRNCNHSLTRRHNRSLAQRHSSTHSRKSARSHNTNYNRPSDGTPLHRRRSASQWRRPAQPPPTQYDVSWENS
jgi:hypothetical protein